MRMLLKYCILRKKGKLDQTFVHAISKISYDSSLYILLGKMALFATGKLRVFHFDHNFEIFAGAFACRVKCAKNNV